jgi:hypothetical protein
MKQFEKRLEKIIKKCLDIFTGGIYEKKPRTTKK